MSKFINFIKLTDVSYLTRGIGTEISGLSINVDSIERFYVTNGVTCVHLKRVDAYHEVKETPKEIEALILAIS